MTKKILFAILLILPLTMMAQDLKFGYCNRVKIFQEMPETLAAQKKMDTLSKDYESELMKMQTEYKKKGAAFVASQDTLPESIRKRRMTEIQDLQQRLDAFYQDSQKDIQKQQQQLLVPINKKLMEAIKTVGDEKGLVYIVDTSTNGGSGVLYWNTEKCVDITAAVKAKLNLN